jgi:hypothetical protein
MIGRRLLLGGLAAASCRSAGATSQVPAPDTLAFHILRKAETIGEHTLTFTRTANDLTVEVAVDIVVGIGPIAFFRYRHRATERRSAGRVTAVDSETNDDGTPHRMTARREDAGLVVEGSRASRYTAPPRSLPGTHWDRAMLDAPFINTEDGRLMHPTVTPDGMHTIDVTGGAVEAQCYKLRGDCDLDTYYDAAWAGLQFIARDGSQIRYVRA